MHIRFKWTLVFNNLSFFYIHSIDNSNLDSNFKFIYYELNFLSLTKLVQEGTQILSKIL